MRKPWDRAIAIRARRLWRLRPRFAAVLVYHRVATTVEDPYDLAVTPSTFESQLREARRHGELVSADELVDRLAAGESVRGLIAVTFDDGYVDNLSTAAGIAAQVEAPITVFITVQAVLHGVRFWWDELACAILGTEPSAANEPLVVGGVTIARTSRTERVESLQRLHYVMRRASARRRATLLQELAERLRPAAAIDVGRPMTDHELRSLAALPGVAIGAHTMTHPSLAPLDASEQLAEVASSREALERLLGTQVRLLAYPFGKTDDVSAATRNAARAAGFHAAFTTLPHPVQPRTDLMAIPRLTVHGWSRREFAARLDALVR